MIDGYVAGYDAWNECHPDNPEYKNKKDMNKRKWKDYMEAHLSGQWAWPVPPFDITTIHGVTFNVRKINPTGTLEGLLPDGRTQIATFEYVDINSIVLPHQPFPDWISWRTENGWNMQPDASWLKHGNSSSRRNTESLYALYESEKAKAKPTEPAPAQQGEIPEEIESLLKNLARSGWQFARNAHRLYPDNKHTFSDYSATTLPKDLEPAIACYHKMQEEIAIYKNMWMIADKTMNELRLKVQELNKITNG